MSVNKSLAHKPGQAKYMLTASLMKTNSLIISLIVLTFFLRCVSSDKAPVLPNIVIIFTDDQGYGDLGTYGATQFTTPHLDRLAREGIRFTHFYSAQAVCSASRAGLLTGCYPNRIGISGALGPQSKVGIHDDEMTIAELVKQKGYATGIFGKWHLGHYKEFLPLQHGFDEYFGLPYSNDMWPVDYDGTLVTEESKNSFKLRYPTLPLIEGNERTRDITTLKDQAQLVTWYTEKAVSFIEKNKDKPFLLYLPHSMPHVPLGVSDKFIGKSEQGMYGDVMMEIDWSVGEVLAALEKHGLDENTLVVFTTDNGPWLNYGNHAGSTGGLREGKGTSFEGGQRVPGIMRWPAKISAGTVSNKMASTIDIFSTVAEITGAPLPDHPIDGVSLVPLLTGEVGAGPRDEFWYYYGRNNLEAVRKGKWKLVLPHKHRSYEGQLPANDGWPGKTVQDSTGVALYNLRRDPGEEYDVQELYPEVVEELNAIAEAARKELGDNLTDRKGSGNREPGRVE